MDTTRRGLFATLAGAFAALTAAKAAPAVTRQTASPRMPCPYNENILDVWEERDAADFYQLDGRRIVPLPGPNATAGDWMEYDAQQLAARMEEYRRQRHQDILAPRPVWTR